MKLIGLTGNIACGKSTVARILAEAGAAVIDADQLAREVVKPGMPALQKITHEFGQGVLDESGALDRPKMRKIIFNDEKKREILEAILHPEIQKLSQSLIEEYRRENRKAVFYEATLLVETGRYRDFDGLLVVTCGLDSQIKRLIARDPNVSDELARRIIGSQLAQARKTSVATWVIENNGTEEDLRRQVEAWYRAL